MMLMMLTDDVCYAICPAIRQCASASAREVAPSRMLQGFGSTTEIQKEIIGRSLGP
jgi:hypothetical protein